MQGTTLSFVCPTYYVLVGPNTITCIGNGEWEPDPKEVECRGMYCTNSLIALKGFRECTINYFVGLKEIKESISTNYLTLTTEVSFTVVVFLLILVLSFVVGYVCGHHFGRKHKQSSSSLTQPVSLYECATKCCGASGTIPSGVGTGGAGGGGATGPQYFRRGARPPLPIIKLNK